MNTIPKMKNTSPDTFLLVMRPTTIITIVVGHMCMDPFFAANSSLGTVFCIKIGYAIVAKRYLECGATCANIAAIGGGKMNILRAKANNVPETDT